MRDLKGMGIEDIERQIHNYRLFFAFLKKHNVYRLFRKKMFSDINRTPYDLMRTIVEEYPAHYGGDFGSLLTNRIDKRWALVLIFVPYFGGVWDTKLREDLPKVCDIKSLMSLNNKWKEFLYNNNYDKMKVNNDSTFTFN